MLTIAIIIITGRMKPIRFYVTNLLIEKLKNMKDSEMVFSLSVIEVWPEAGALWSH